MNVSRSLTLLLVLTLLIFSCTKEDDIPGNERSQPDSNAIQIELDEGLASKSGDLRDGKALASLDWAWSSSSACFATPIAHRYAGNHIFYTVQLPVNATISIKLIPDDMGSDMAIYGYSTSGESAILPEDLLSCLTCEADPASGESSSNKEYRSIEIGSVKLFEDLPQIPSTVLIGVAGAEGVTAGAFTLEIALDK